MNNIYPYIIVLVFGILAAGAINYISDKLFLNRQIYPLEFSPEMQDNFWKKYFLSPWKLTGIEAKHLKRIIVLYPIFVMVSFWLMFSDANYVSYYWGIALLTYFGIVAVMDLEQKVVLFPVAKLGVIVGLVWGFNARGIFITLLGGVIGYGIMYVFYLFGQLFVKYLSKKRGNPIEEVALGFGDVMIGGILGLILGWPAIIPGLVLGIFIGGVMSGVLLLFALLRRNYQSFVAIPYAPFLLAGTVLIIFFKQLF